MFVIFLDLMAGVLGCGRTRNECQRWKKMKPYEIKNINKELNKRLNKIKLTNFTN